MRSAALPLLALLAPLLGACALDPFDRPGTWSAPQGAVNANDANLRTMIVDPRDLTAGTGEDNSSSRAAAPAVKRLLSGQRAPLLPNGTSSVRQQTAPPAAAPTATAGSAPQ